MELNETVTKRRRQTRSSIYRYLYSRRDFTTKQAIARDMGLSLPTVYQNLLELIDAGLVYSTGEQRSTGGRPATGLGIVEDARIAIGISVTDTKLRLAATGLRLGEIAYRSIPYSFIRNPEGAPVYIASELERFLDDYSVRRDRLLGVGIAFPGIISEDMGSILFAPTLHMAEYDLSPLKEAIPYPVCIRNDGTCGGHAEWFVRAESGMNGGSGNLAYLSLESGVGGCILLDGKLYAGDHTRSGEFGHIRVGRRGLVCECGKKDCLEAYCTSRRITDDLGLTPEEFFSALNAGNREYDALWEDILHHLAIGINTINTALDCDIVLGGFLAEYLLPWMERLKAYVAEENPFSPNGDFVHLSSLKSHNVALGAALHYIEEFICTI